MLHDLTVDDVDSAGAGVLGLVTASEDGTYVYFVAEGELTSEKNAEGEEAVTGQPNLYLTHAGVVTFIATLASSVGRIITKIIWKTVMKKIGWDWKIRILILVLVVIRRGWWGMVRVWCLNRCVG